MSTFSRAVRVLAFSSSLLAPAALAGNVLVVSASGGGDYFRIQRAVDAAVDGDTILVKGGAYPGFTILDKRVYVVAETGQAVTVNGTVNVTNLAASRDVVLAGLAVQGTTHGLQLVSNAGSVRVQACSFAAVDLTGSQLHGATVLDCADVAFASCVLEGGEDYFFSGAGLRATSSSVALYDCTLRGAEGYDVEPFCPDGPSEGNLGGHASAGAWVSSTFLFASGTTFQGGNGGDAQNNCGFSGDGGGGGAGLRADASSETSVLGCTFTAGFGGSFGCGPFMCGEAGFTPPPTFVEPGSTLTTLPGTRRKLTAPAVVREPPAAVPVSIEGQVGDRVFLSISRQAIFQYVANQSGVRLTPLSPPPVVLDLGIVPAGGTLNTTIPSYELGMGVESRVYFLQSLHKLPSGQRILGSPASLIVLDSSF